MLTLHAGVVRCEDTDKKCMRGLFKETEKCMKNRRLIDFMLGFTFCFVLMYTIAVL